jgi:uncharacterized protein (TIRG00374 family)
LPKTKLLFAIKAAISIGLIGLILWRADLRATVAAVRNVYVLAFVAALGSTVVGVVLRSYKWHLLLRVQGGRESFLTSLRVMYMSTFVNNFFLGTLGGDAFRVYHARDYSNSAGGAASAVVFERATGMLSALMLVYLSGALIASEELITAKLLVVISGVGLLIGIGIAVLLSMGPKVSRIPILRRAHRLTGFVKNLTASLWTYKRHPALFVWVMILSAVFHITQAVTVYLFALAARADIPFLSLLFITPLTGLLVVLPISINGIGVKEGSFVFYLERIGIPGPAALLIAISGRVGNMMVSLIGGLLFLIQGLGRRKRAMATEEEKIKWR